MSLGRAGIAVANFSLGQPSLDEVFLALTGHTAEEVATNGDTAIQDQDETKSLLGFAFGALSHLMSTPETRTTQAPILQEPDLNKALATSRPPKAGAVSAVLTFGWRGMLKVKHVPEQLVDVTITPVMFVLLFTYLFGGAIEGSTGAYRDYIMPGVLVIGVLFTTVYSGIALNTDITKGRPLPLAADLALLTARRRAARRQRALPGLLDGDHRPRADPRLPAGGGVPGVLGAVALVVIFSFGLSWVFTTMGLLMRSPNAVMNAGFMSIFPLTFLSNVYVQPSTLPAGVEAFVNVNPISNLVSACRGLLAGDFPADDIGISLAVAAGLTAVFLPLTTRLYAKASARPTPQASLGSRPGCRSAASG